MRVIPSCEDLARSVSDGSYVEGSWHVRVRLRLHMVSCWICRRYTAQIRWIDNAAKSVLASPAGADPDFKRRLIGRLKS
jgi:hypothetical protein